MKSSTPVWNDPSLDSSNPNQRPPPSPVSRLKPLPSNSSARRKQSNSTCLKSTRGAAATETLWPPRTTQQNTTWTNMLKAAFSQHLVGPNSTLTLMKTTRTLSLKREVTKESRTCLSLSECKSQLTTLWISSRRARKWEDARIASGKKKGRQKLCSNKCREHLVRPPIKRETLSRTKSTPGTSFIGRKVFAKVVLIRQLTLILTWGLLKMTLTTKSKRKSKSSKNSAPCPA